MCESFRVFVFTRADVEMINSFMEEPVLLDQVWLLKEINSK